MSDKIRRATTLIITDTELNCNCPDLSIEELSLSNIGLNQDIIKNFDLILYSGKKGTKLLKSTWTKTGVIR